MIRSDLFRVVSLRISLVLVWLHLVALWSKCHRRISTAARASSGKFPVCTTVISKSYHFSMARMRSIRCANGVQRSRARCATTNFQLPLIYVLTKWNGAMVAWPTECTVHVRLRRASSTRSRQFLFERLSAILLVVIFYLKLWNLFASSIGSKLVMVAVAADYYYFSSMFHKIYCKLLLRLPIKQSIRTGSIYDIFLFSFCILVLL